jgi:hypothetical protein
VFVCVCVFIEGTGGTFTVGMADLTYNFL